MIKRKEKRKAKGEWKGTIEKKVKVERRYKRGNGRKGRKMKQRHECLFVRTLMQNNTYRMQSIRVTTR